VGIGTGIEPRGIVVALRFAFLSTSLAVYLSILSLEC